MGRQHHSLNIQTLIFGRNDRHRAASSHGSLQLHDGQGKWNGNLAMPFSQWLLQPCMHCLLIILSLSTLPPYDSHDMETRFATTSEVVLCDAIRIVRICHCVTPWPCGFACGTTTLSSRHPQTRRAHDSIFADIRMRAAANTCSL